MIPWLFFGCIICFYLFSITSLSTHNINGAFYDVLESIYRGFLGNEDSYCFYTIWFLIALFEISIFYAFIYKVLKNIYLQTFAWLSLYIIGWILQERGINLPYFIDTAFSIGIYYHLGFLFKETKYYNIKIPFPFVMLSFACLLGAIFFFKPNIELKYNIYPFYTALLSTLFITTLYYLIKFILGYSNRGISLFSKVFQKLGQDSLIIFGLHRPLFELSYVIQSQVIINQKVFALLQILGTIIVIECLSPILYKYVPYLVGKYGSKS